MGGKAKFISENIPEFKELISQSMSGALLLIMNKQLQFLFNQLITLTDQKCSDAVNSAILRSVLCLVLNVSVSHLAHTFKQQI